MEAIVRIVRASPDILWRLARGVLDDLPADERRAWISRERHRQLILCHLLPLSTLAADEYVTELHPAVVAVLSQALGEPLEQVLRYYDIVRCENYLWRAQLPARGAWFHDGMIRADHYFYQYFMNELTDELPRPEPEPEPEPEPVLPNTQRLRSGRPVRWVSDAEF